MILRRRLLRFTSDRCYCCVPGLLDWGSVFSLLLLLGHVLRFCRDLGSRPRRRLRCSFGILVWVEYLPTFFQRVERKRVTVTVVEIHLDGPTDCVRRDFLCQRLGYCSLEPFVFVRPPISYTAALGKNTRIICYFPALWTALLAMKST